MKKASKPFLSRLKAYGRESVLLLRSIPSPVVALFVLSVVAMNLLANKTLVNLPYLAIDGGILVSWLSFMCMDIVAKHFGPRASTRMSVFAIIVNLLSCLIFFIVSAIPTQDDYAAFNQIFGGTWFILLSSTVAFFCSALINNVTNFWLGRFFKRNPNGRLAFAMRSFFSTFLGQFFDNLIFAVLCFMVFAPIFWDGFSWTFVQCVTCSLLGAALELVLEIVFSPIAYRITRIWARENVGKDYFAFQEAKRLEVEE